MARGHRQGHSQAGGVYTPLPECGAFQASMGLLANVWLPLCSLCSSPFCSVLSLPLSISTVLYLVLPLKQANVSPSPGTPAPGFPYVWHCGPLGILNQGYS